jgi:uncharacterized protein YdhG (YjbR/CyaY superfamily)
MKAERAAAPKTISAYIGRFPQPVQKVLKQVRGTIQKAVPKAKEVISYGIPAYKMDGGAVIYFAGWKEHYSLYPANRRLVAAFKDDLASYEVNNKGTIRFPLSGRVPVRLIANITKFRAREVAEEAKMKAKAKASR